MATRDIPAPAWQEPAPTRHRLRRLTTMVTTMVTRPRKTALTNLISMPLTIAGYACIDYGVFTASKLAGWIVTGITLMILELQVTDQ